MTFNGVAYSVAGPRFVASFGPSDGVYTYYTSGPATGQTVGDFTPWFGTFFFGRSIGASGLTLDTSTDRLSALIDDVVALDLGTGITNALVKKLNAALAAISDEGGNNDVAAANVISAFIHQVEAQRGKRLTDAEATYLVESAETIILALGD